MSHAGLKVPTSVKIIATASIERKEVERLKKCMPYIFPEYNAMCDAERRLDEAAKEYEAARRRWDKLGRSK